MTRSVSPNATVAKLSAIMTESINKPERFASCEEDRTVTLARCPALAMLLEIIATMV